MDKFDSQSSQLTHLFKMSSEDIQNTYGDVNSIEELIGVVVERHVQLSQSVLDQTYASKHNLSDAELDLELNLNQDK